MSDAILTDKATELSLDLAIERQGHEIDRELQHIHQREHRIAHRKPHASEPAAKNEPVELRPASVCLASLPPGSVSFPHKRSSDSPIVPTAAQTDGCQAVPNPNGTPEAYANANPYPRGRWL